MGIFNIQEMEERYIIRREDTQRGRKIKRNKENEIENKNKRQSIKSKYNNP